ncbi:oligopeptide/dipeptide ABC transporter ATP-binding protein [Rhizohabitans arisaemae]|uniref:oligopeptide/dipeptide ABC transporter ATP-binding protein n=1 Tax=Rhizohabitans arisaemae TaxID=2720610 RepID=UPI0024B1D6E9|nr:ABC transporter ATP-binding protein [Rhizohabitans arisaemae]
MSVLSIADLHVDYRRRGRPTVQAVAGVSLSVEKGQILGLVGESGCGKSTLARAAVGLVAPSAGTVEFDGSPTTRLSRGTRPAHLLGLQMVFQNPYASLNPRRRVGAQIADGVGARSRTKVRADDPRVAAVLELVGLPTSAAGRYPHEFSGGQRQRLAIARVLAAEPSAVVLDEPLSSLDASAQAQIASLLVELKDKLSLAILLISHDLSVVRQVADVLAVMYLGRVVEVGPTEQIWSDPRHPYTQALIGAVPQPDGLGTLPTALPGEVPDPARPPSGCRFHPRCPEAIARCSVEQPDLTVLVPSGRKLGTSIDTPIGTARSAACWLRIDTEAR